MNITYLEMVNLSHFLYTVVNPLSPMSIDFAPSDGEVEVDFPSSNLDIHQL